MIYKFEILCLFLEAQNNTNVYDNSSIFLNEAFSNYVVFSLGLLSGLIGWLIVTFVFRKSPQVLEVLYTEQISLLEVDSQIEEDIQIEYKGKLVDSLYKTSLSFFNRGEEVIDHPKFFVKTSNQNLQDEVLYKAVFDFDGNEADNSEVLMSGSDIEISIEFLNPYKKYRDQLSIHMFSRVPIKVESARGRGSGWTVTYFDQLEYEGKLKAALNEALAGGGSNLILGLVKSLGIVIGRFFRSHI